MRVSWLVTMQTVPFVFDGGELDVASEANATLVIINTPKDIWLSNII